MGIHYADSDDFEGEFDELDEDDTADEDAPETNLLNKNVPDKGVPPQSGKHRKWRTVEEYREWKRLNSQLDGYEFDEDDL